MNVVRKVNVYVYMYGHAKVPQFDIEKMPFVIFRGAGGFYLVNIKTCTYQNLVNVE